MPSRESNSGLPYSKTMHYQLQTKLRHTLAIQYKEISWILFDVARSQDDTPAPLFKMDLKHEEKILDGFRSAERSHSTVEQFQKKMRY